jgi:2'-5' RNA ligase
MGHDKKGVGIPSSYKEEAGKKTDVLWKVTIKGRRMLADDIPLHMSLRVFDYLTDKQMDAVKRKVKEHEVCTPDSKDLKFKTTLFHSRHTHRDYYMLKISGIDEACEKFFNEFKEGYGFSHDKFMPHITIDKDLYDKINKDGLEPDEIKFDALTIEEGAGNTVHDFDDKESKELSKGIKHIGAALGITAALAGAPTQAKQTPQQPTKDTVTAIKPQAQNQYNSKRMLNTIASVESQHGKLENHKPITHGLNSGETAFGKYGLTPNTIRETIHMNRDLQAKHAKAMSLHGNDMTHYMQDNPGLEDQVAAAHLKRLEHHFGQNPGKIGYSWLNGISGTNKAIKNKQDIDNHWHVKKIKDAYAKEK